jgi:protein-disulfide isomerase
MVPGDVCQSMIPGASKLAALAVVAVGLLPLTSWPQQVEHVSPAGVQAILAKPGIELTGTHHPDVTIVEYFDYNCPYCRRLGLTFRRLIAADGKIAIIYKDWPILGEVSVYAARCALAAGYQGEYLVAHDALLDGPRLSQDDQVESLLQVAGIDIERLRKDLTAHSQDIDALLARNGAEADALELQGTPGILVGRQLVSGVADLSFIQRMITEARSASR